MLWVVVTPMAYGEFYTALQQGVLDGGENAAGNVLNDKFLISNTINYPTL